MADPSERAPSEVDEDAVCEYCGILLDECLADRCPDRREWMIRELGDPGPVC